jgi:hypothetical protein
VKGKPEKVREKEVKDSFNFKIYKGFNNERNDLKSCQIQVKGKKHKIGGFFPQKNVCLGILQIALNCKS